MRDFLHTIGSSLSTGQRRVLQRFLEDANAGRIPASPESIRAALDQVGTLLEVPDVDVTDPEGYNAVVRTLIANIAGMYQEVDRIEAIQNSLSDLNTSELDRIELAIRDQVSILDATKRANAANIQWTDVFYETFGADVRSETNREWYKPLPILSATGQVESFLPLAVDPVDKSLKLAPGGDFLRSTTPDGSPLVALELDELLGLSSDKVHPLSQAIDGKFYSYWRELILSDASIFASPTQVPWLPDTYIAGAAARLHFKFPFAVPFTELVFSPFSKYPIRVLQVVWDNRKQTVNNFPRDQFFSSGATFWTSGAGFGTSLTFQVSGGFKNGRFASIFAASGRTTLTSNMFALNRSQPACHFHYKVNRQKNIHPLVLVNWYDNGGTLVRGDWTEPTLPKDEWFEYSKLFNAPSGAVSGEVILVADGSGSVKYSDVVFNECIGTQNINQQAELEAESVTIQLDNATGTDIWVVINQPHYEFLQLSVSEGDLNTQELWNEVQLQVESQVEKIYGFSQNPWRLEAGALDITPAIDVDDSSTLVQEAKRLGGRIRDMVVNLMQFARPSNRPNTVTKYLYVLGAWEIQVKHREYSPQGLFVSLPYTPRGEVRELVLVTNPPVGSDSRIRFWLTARASDKSDKAKLLEGRARFSASTETAAATGPTYFVLPPVSRRDIFTRVDRDGKLTLPQHPYINRERAWSVNSQVSSGNIAFPLSYDPNKEIYYISVSGSLIQVLGYRPVKVTIEFSDGIIARPDTLGKLQPGDIGVAGPEVLESASVETETTSFNEQREDQEEPTSTVRVPRLPGILQNTSLARGRRQTASGKTKSQKRTEITSDTSLKTQFKNIISGPNGVTFSLYHHKGGDDILAGRVITSGDILISPSRYVVDNKQGLVIVRSPAPSGNTQYDKFIAYYHFLRDEVGAREALDSRSGASLPGSGVDFGAPFTQSLPVTRNVTDYVRGQLPRFRNYNGDALSPDYYPVYEYVVDGKGRIVFGEPFVPFITGTPARITVEYESLEIEPRLIIEYQKVATNEFSTKTPVIRDVTIFMNSRK